jgi:hypothetical protein
MPCVTQLPVYGFVYNNIPAWDGGARSIVSFAGNGYFSWTAPESVAGVVVGFNINDASYHYSDIQHGFHFRRGEYRVIEGGVWKDQWRSYSTSDSFFVFRAGSDVLYVHSTQTDPTYFTTDSRYPGLLLPDAITYISDVPSFGRVFLDASLFETGDYVINENGGPLWLPGPTAGSNVQGQEAVAGGSLPFTLSAYGSASQGSFNGIGYGELAFELTATGRTEQGVFAGTDRGGAGILPFVLRAGDTLRGWVRGELPFRGGLGNGAAGTDGFQDAIGGKVRGFIGFDLAGTGSRANQSGVTAGLLPFIGQALGRVAAGDDDVLLLLHCDTDTPFVDSSSIGHTVTSVGDVQSVAVDATWGGAALFDGDGDALVVGAAGDFNLLHDGSDYELDMRVYFDSSAASQCLFDTGGPQTATRGAFLWSNASSNLQMLVANGSGGYALSITGSTTVTPDTWHQIRIVSDGGVVTVYLDGSVEASGSLSSPSASNSSFALNFGRRAFDGGLDFNGQMDEIRINGEALTTAPFSPPTAPFPDPAEDRPVQGAAYGELGFTMFGASAMTGANYFNILLPEFGQGTAAPVSEELSDVISAISTIASAGSAEVEISESVAVQSAIEAYYAFALRETVVVRTTLQQFTQQAVEILSAFGVNDRVRIALALRMAETFAAEGTLQTTEAVQLAERLVASGIAQTHYQAIETLMSAVALSDATRAAFAYTVSSSAEFSDDVALYLAIQAIINETFSAADSTDTLLTLVAIFSDQVNISDGTELTAQYFAELLDGARVYSLLKTPAELAQGWVMNTERAMPVSEYDNYTFNSLAYAPHEMIGCTDQGVYTMTGDDDAGAPIAAELTSMMLDFATSRQKRLSAAWIGYKADGELVLRVRAVDMDELVEYCFVGRNVSGAPAQQENRFKLGKGLRSRYWQFELINKEGADFEIDQVELYPIRLDRRV